jgi:hypothetical protein
MYALSDCNLLPNMINLHCNQNKYHIQCHIFNADNHTMCAISHENINRVDTEQLPSTWEHFGVKNAVKLPCGHTFHVSVISFHFIVNDMRCPICRLGSLEKMSLECIPIDIREIFTRRLSAMESVEDADDIEEIIPGEYISESLLSATTDELERDLQIVVLMKTPTSMVIIPSRLRRAAHLDYGSIQMDIPDGHEIYYPVPSFWRIFDNQVVANNNTDMQIVVRICNSVFEDAISSGIYSLRQFQNMCTQNNRTRLQTEQSSLHMQNIRCGSLVGRCLHDESGINRFQVHLNRSIVRTMIASSLINRYETYNSD